MIVKWKNDVNYWWKKIDGDNSFTILKNFEF